MKKEKTLRGNVRLISFIMSTGLVSNYSAVVHIFE